MISLELRNLIRIAQDREQKEDHLTDKERKVLSERIRIEDNIDNSVSWKQIYEDYIIC